MSRIAIIGAGHAGVAAAVSARQAGADVVLYSNESCLPYFRPRLPGVAFGQQTIESIAMHPLDWYADKAITLRLEAAVQAIDPTRRSVVAADGTETFDALVVATGAVPLLPAIDGLTPDLPVHTLWSQADAAQICAQVTPGRRLVIVGGGILGLEAALRAREANLEVIVIERLSRLMPLQFGEAGSAVIQATLESIGVSVVTNARLMAIERHGQSVRLHLGNNEPLAADLVLFSIGARPNLLLGQTAGLATDLGLCADVHLQTVVPGVFVAGDVAQAGSRPQCSVRSASIQGKLAGANAAAAVVGGDLQRLVAKEFPVFFKSRELELYAIGKTVSERLTESRLDDGGQSSRYQAVVKDGEAVVGVQMIGTHDSFDSLADQVAAETDS